MGLEWVGGRSGCRLICVSAQAPHVFRHSRADGAGREHGERKTRSG
jgi:hypothetical protein